MQNHKFAPVYFIETVFGFSFSPRRTPCLAPQKPKMQNIRFYATTVVSLCSPFNIGLSSAKGHLKKMDLIISSSLFHSRWQESCPLPFRCFLAFSSDHNAHLPLNPYSQRGSIVSLQNDRGTSFIRRSVPPIKCARSFLPSSSSSTKYPRLYEQQQIWWNNRN